jgi:hypothetical protein
MLTPAAALAQNAHATAMQAASAALANLPDADVLIYVSPQRILTNAAPKLMPPAEFAKMRSGFADIKKTVGVDPATIDYLVIALRFHKPGSDLSFQAPDVLAVVGGDFSSDALLTLAQLSLQDKLRQEKHGAKTMSLMRVDPIAAQAEKLPLLKSLVEVGAVALNANTLAVGSVSYLKAAVDAAEGTGRINPATLQSLLRDPNVLVAATGAPITSLAKAFGLFGTETTPRDSRCDTSFGNFYSAITINGSNFSLRGAMNADNPDTAKIISGLLAGLMQQGIDSVPDKKAQAILQSIKMTPRENEIIWEAEIAEQAVAEIFRTPPKAATIEVKTTPRRTARRKRSR